MDARDDRPAPPIEQLLGAMEQWGASDLLLSVGKVPAVRMHGEIATLEVPPMRDGDLERFAAIALGEGELRELSTAGGGATTAFTLPSGARFRVSISRRLGTLDLFARALPRAPATFEELGLPASLAAFVERRRGIVLITGKPGSGRSSTLAALVRELDAHRALLITTLEAPVEQLHTDTRSRITQREVGSDVPSFEQGIRRALEECADVLVISELRDAATARAALDAAQAGQLVLAAIDASDGVRALSRVVGLFPQQERSRIADVLASTLVGAAALRLVPRRDGAGRVAAVEVLAAAHAITRCVREEAWQELDELVTQEQTPGVVGFDAALESLCRRGAIAPEVALSHASNTDGLVRRLRGTLPHTDLGQRSGFDIQSLIAAVQKRGASDLHLSVGRPPTLRVDGRLETQGSVALTAYDVEALVRSIMSAPQRARFSQYKEVDFSFTHTDGRRFRVNAYHERGNVAIALRAIASQIPDAAMLGLPPAVLQMGDEPHGLLLVVGPTGAGKTTTLACLIDRINHTRPCHIITVEDPIEYLHQSDRATVHQREVGPDTDSFAHALKYVLRQDPDVVLIGELRDLETVSAALTAAETGHLVLATLHTNDAVQTIDRIIDVFPSYQQAQARMQLSASLIGVVSQRLLPRADGKGRLAAFEVMVASSAIRNLVREAKMHQALGVIQTSRATGMVTMEQALDELLKRGAIDKDEASRYMQGAGNADKSRPKATPG